MSPLVLLGIGALAAFTVLVVVFLLTLVVGQGVDSTDDLAEDTRDPAVDEAFPSHGGRSG